MGCTQSKIERAEAVSRCKHRIRFLKEAISSRHAFAAAHGCYAMLLRYTGGALNDYTKAEFLHLPPSAAASPSTQIPPRRRSAPSFQNPEVSGFEAHRPQQPPKEEAVRRVVYGGDYIFAPGETTQGGPSLAVPEAIEGLSRKELEEKVNGGPIEVESEPLITAEGKVELPLPLPVPLRMKGMENGVRARGRRSAKPSSFLQVFADLDDHFLKAFESAREVSNMMEVSRLHYDINFADNCEKGWKMESHWTLNYSIHVVAHIDHSKRVMGAITWNHSVEGFPNADDSENDFDEEENETHASVLDKLLAWEKKLYDEVKAAEIMDCEYRKKVALLNEQKKRGSDPESLEKLEVAVSHLHTRYTVDIQSMDSTVAEINRLRDLQLYPKLVQLVDGMATMWETMRYHHEAQTYVAFALKSLDYHEVVRETSESLHDFTMQLTAVVSDWQTQFCRLIEYQKEYIRALSNWVKLTRTPIESNLKEQVTSPPKVQSPPIHDLLIDWDDDLDKLPDEVARSAISIFAAALKTIVNNQTEEINMRKACESKEKKLQRVGGQYLEFGIIGEIDADNPLKIAKEEKESAVISSRQPLKLQEKEEECLKICRQVREQSLASLKHRLPELFRAMSEIALACSVMYSSLRAPAECQFPGQNL